MQATLTKQNIDIEVIKNTLLEKIGSVGYTSWIEPLQLELSNNVLYMIAHNRFAVDYIKDIYGSVIDGIAKDFSLNIDIHVGVRTNNVCSANDNVVCDARNNFVKNVNTIKNLNEFDKFIVSDDNMFVLAACKQIALTNSSLSQLFIYGPSGSGKTLLSNCIYQASNQKVLMMSGAQFVVEFARSLKDKTIFAFKDKCRDCDIFILDDVCALSGKRASTEEFLQLMIDLRNCGKKIVLTSTIAPNALTGFDRRIQSLFASGLVVDVNTPNTYVRRLMLRHSGMDAQVADELANNIVSDGHVVMGVINKVKNYTELMNEKVDMDIATRLLKDVLNKVKTPIMMVKSMCDKMGISYDVLCGNSRVHRLVHARQLMMFVLKEMTHLSLTEIGNLCGGRDHSTVVYAINQVEEQKNTDLMISAEIDSMIQLCK